MSDIRMSNFYTRSIRDFFNICVYIMNVFLLQMIDLNRVDSRCKENVSKSRFNLRGNMNFHDSIAKYFVYLGRTPRSRALSSICKMLMYLRSSYGLISLSRATSVSLRRDTRFPIEQRAISERTSCILCDYNNKKTRVKSPPQLHDLASNRKILTLSNKILNFKEHLLCYYFYILV